MAESLIRTLVDGSASVRSGIRDIGRARQIASIFVRHGFSEVLEKTRIRRSKAETLKGLPARLTAVLEELGPTFIKFGQILSTRQDVLPADVVRALERLQDKVDPLPFDVVREVIESELGGDIEDIFTSIDQSPLASASIAQVHRACLSGEDVVVKVQRPGLKEKIVSDLSLLRFLIQRILNVYPELHVLDLPGSVDSFSTSLLGELDFRQEAEALIQFAHNFEADTKVKIPRVIAEASTGVLLVMEELKGTKLTELTESSMIQQAADHYLDIAFRMFFEHGHFHGDLHPGNVFWMDDGRLGLIDFGTTGHLSKKMREDMAGVTMAIVNEDLPAVARTWLRLGQPTRPVDYEKYERDVIDILNSHVVGQSLKNVQFGLFLNDLSLGAIRHGIRVPSHLAILFKAMVTTEGLARQLLPDVDIVEAAKPYIEKSIKDKYHPDVLKKELFRQAVQWSEASENLPWRLNQILTRVEKGDFQMRVETDGMNKLADSLAKGLNRLALSIIAVGFGIGGVFVRNSSGEKYGVFPVESVLSWGISGLALFFLFSYMRKEK